MSPEEFLPKDVLAKATVSGNEYAWRRDNVSEAILAAKEAGLATIGGQTQFRLPDGTCELYWLSYDASPKSATVTWDEYVVQSTNECLTKFRRLCETTDFVVAGVEAFEFLRHKAEIEDISQYLCFVIYFDTEETYSQ